MKWPKDLRVTYKQTYIPFMERRFVFDGITDSVGVNYSVCCLLKSLESIQLSPRLCRDHFYALGALLVLNGVAKLELAVTRVHALS